MDVLIDLYIKLIADFVHLYQQKKAQGGHLSNVDIILLREWETSPSYFNLLFVSVEVSDSIHKIRTSKSKNWSCSNSVTLSYHAKIQIIINNWKNIFCMGKLYYM